MSYYVWVGPREIDCLSDSIFSDTICYYSKKNRKNLREAHIYGTPFNSYIQQQMEYVITEHPDAKFVFYNPKTAYYLKKELRQNIICLNSLNLLNMLNDKIYTRFWLSQYVSTLPSIMVDSPSLSFNDLKKRLCDSKQYVAQESHSSGGFGTFILSRDNNMLEYLKREYKEVFILSPYLKNSFAVNVNAIIDENNIIIFPPSLQVSENNNGRILYHGADYIAGQKLKSKIKNKININSQVILEHIRQLGYRGIIGLDFLITEKNIYFLEVNPRYQASSFLINIALKEQELPSLSKMNIQAFEDNQKIDFSTKEIKINYSFYKYIYQKDMKHLYHVYGVATPGKYIKQIVPDGWNPDMKNEIDAYCYSLIFKTNIISINPDFYCDLYSNIHGEEEFLRQNIKSDIGLKIALVNQGCVIETDAKEYLESIGIIKKAVFSAIDFRLSNGIPINAPVNLKFTELSPFSIRYDGELKLYHYDSLISEIRIEMQPAWSNMYTKNGIPFSRIAYLSTDRLRLKHESVCSFKVVGEGCHFCNLPEKTLSFNQDDFEEVLDSLLINPSFRHILIGGGTGNPDFEVEHILSVVKMIRKRNSNIPIYLMSIPPKDESILIQYKEAGITEVAFNIEILDRDYAKIVMPGKGKIELEHYFDMLIKATKLWGNKGNVRTALLVGLNKTQSLLDGTNSLCQKGIQPMFSIFRPESVKLFL